MVWFAQDLHDWNGVPDKPAKKETDWEEGGG